VSDLFDSLKMATRSLEAQRLALGVTGHNIANVNTPGYTRRVVDMAAIPPDTAFSAGRGVVVAGIRAERDRLIAARLDREVTAEQREAAIADALRVVETALGPAGQSIDRRLSEFFSGFARLAESPASAVARQEVVLQGVALAAAFRDTAGRLTQSRLDANRQIIPVVSEVNELAARIATLNSAIATATSNAALHLQDEQAVAVRQLAALVDINVLHRTDGGVDIDVADGQPLVVAHHVYGMTAVASGADGMLSLSINGADLTADITGGRLGGLLQVRDQHLPDYLQRLDAQAYALADAVNTLHAAGYDLNGNTNQAFFVFSTPPAGTTGAARALGVDATLTADPSRVAAAGVPLATDNTQARALAELEHARVLDGGTATLSDGWSQLVYRVGRDVQSARSERVLRQEVVRQFENLRDQVSGVSLDEEAMHLMKFQRAYEANARFFRVIDQTLETLLNTFAR
jgi:flagellar hook-associated protein 1